MEMETATIVLDTTAERTFEFVSELANLPRWATEFARDFDLDGRRARIRTPDGPAVVKIAADADTRTVDFVVEPETGGRAVFPSRVVDLPGGKSGYVFTVPRAPGQSEEELRAAVASLRREFENLRRLLS